MEGSECLCVESLCFHECTDEALGSKGSEGGAGGKAIAGTPPHQSPGTQGLQRGDRAMEVRDWREGGREGGREGYHCMRSFNLQTDRLYQFYSKTQE